MYTALHGLDELRDIGVTRVEARACVDDAHDGAREGILAVAGGFDEDFAQEEGEVGVAVGGEALTESAG